MRQRPPTGNASSPEIAAHPQSADPKRRRFLFALGAGSAGAAAAAAAVLPSAAAATEATAGAAETGYRETEHVRDYYRTARV